MGFFDQEAVNKRSQTVARQLASADRSKKAKAELDAAAEAKRKNMMKEDTSAISDVITLVANQQYSDATNIVQDLLGARVASALDGRKEEIAQNLFVPSADSLNETKE